MTYLLIALLVSTSVVFSRSEEMRCRLTAFAVPLAGKCSRVPSRIYSSKRSSRVAIVGGGLSGLSTAYHLLQKSPALDVTIIDKAEPGVAGASAVAGGLLHPLTPRGKLAYLGLEGISATNKLLDAASKFEKGTVLREEIFRVALDDVHVSTLKQTASNLPEFTQWVEPDERCLGESSPEILGALRLHSGCRVVHVPTYLNGLWSACRSMGSGKKAWVVEDCTDWTDRLSSFDSVVLCAGAGLFQSSIIRDEFPVSLVRGQSVELALGENTCENAMLCGKYVSPLPNENRALIGATHEFKEEPLDSTTVETELRSRSDPFASRLWSKGTVDKITSGYRVQSNRGKDGRLPIIGRFDTPIHSDTWVFTGLSSRGLLYHGVFGDALTDLMLNVEGDAEHQQLDWWRTKVIRR